MIRLDLGAEPAELEQERSRRLPAAIASFNRLGADHEDFGAQFDAGYQIVKDTLRGRQHGKCAFCEKKEDRFKRPVEHFRPKKGADDRVAGKWIKVRTHYWWLTWTWSNLYFSCDECNRVGRKGSRFPLAFGTHRSAAPTQPAPDPLDAAFFDLSAERPLLLDPRTDEPLNHLEWIPVDRTQPRGTWRWTIVGRDERGDVTREVLGLQEREDEVNLHLNVVRLMARQIDAHLAQDRLGAAREAWTELVERYVTAVEQPFRAATWWALESLYPLAERRRNGFNDAPRPAVTAPAGRVQ